MGIGISHGYLRCELCSRKYTYASEVCSCFNATKTDIQTINKHVNKSSIVHKKSQKDTKEHKNKINPD